MVSGVIRQAIDERIRLLATPEQVFTWIKSGPSPHHPVDSQVAGYIAECIRLRQAFEKWRERECAFEISGEK